MCSHHCSDTRVTRRQLGVSSASAAAASFAFRPRLPFLALPLRPGPWIFSSNAALASMPARAAVSGSAPAASASAVASCCRLARADLCSWYWRLHRAGEAERWRAMHARHQRLASGR